MKHCLIPPVLALVLVWPGDASAQSARDAGPTFEHDIRPLFKTHCFPCHGEGDKLKGGLDLRLRRFALQGGKSGPALVPGKPDESLLLQRISKQQMPPGKKKLSNEELSRISQWIARGARTNRPEADRLPLGSTITAEERAFWSFQPIQHPAVPKVAQANRVRTPIDAFIAQKLEARGLTFAPEADRQTLIRRVYFDLLGFPPTPEDVDRFLADPAPDAYERLIDLLLASPRYGERWGRHWLDTAGYADSEGVTSDDPVRPDAFKYRDYVIRAFNQDMPLDRFIREQLAGDETVSPPYQNRTAEELDRLIATGFLRMAPDGTGSSAVDPIAARNQVIADTIKIVSSSLLGLTVGCAQCHDHRYDPIPQTDYYRLRAIFEPAYDVKNWRPPAARRVSLYTDTDRSRSAAIEAQATKIDAQYRQKLQEYIERTFQAELKKLPEALRAPVGQARNTLETKRTPEQKKLLKEHPSVLVTAGSLYLYDSKAADELKKLSGQATAVRATKPVEDFIRALTELPGTVPVTYLYYRGDPGQPRQAIVPGGLAVLDDQDPCRIAAPASSQTSGRRSAFASWLTDGKNPLAARVLVNRFWMHHFGRGLVGTPADFGALGERPTHPELLDGLAHDFMSHGWRLKRLHRLIMTSTVYRQASQRNPANDTLDPDNRLLARMSLRRLDAESLRDAILTVAGNRNDKMFGRPVPVREDEVGQVVLGVDSIDADGRPGPAASLHGEELRRSVYVQVRRSKPLGMLEAFDSPVMEPNCEARHASTVATQSLLLMNNQAILDQAQVLAQRVQREAGSAIPAQVTRAWRLAFGAGPGSEDLKEAAAFVTAQEAKLQKSAEPKARETARLRALAALCQVLMSSNRFLYVE